MVPSPSFGFAVQMDVQIKLENEKEECVLGMVPIVSDVTRKGAQINLDWRSVSKAWSICKTMQQY